MDNFIYASTIQSQLQAIVNEIFGGNMKKLIFGTIFGCIGSFSYADSFQEFNNNIYAQYNYLAPNEGTYPSYNQWGVGGTVQTKNDIWLNANAISGTNKNADVLSNFGIKGGYAFQFFQNDSNGFQLIPYIGLSMQQGGGPQGNGTQYQYALGIKPEYRLLDSLKLALDMNIYGIQTGVTTTSSVGGSSATTDGQNFAYAITPEIQYDISKTVLLGAGYSYTNSFNSQGTVGGGDGNSSINVRVGYLF